MEVSKVRKIFGFLAGVGLIALMASGIFAKAVEFGTWLFMLNYSGPEISIFGEIVVRVLTFAVSYGLVGIVFDAIGLFNDKIMSATYCVISAVFGFIFAYIIWTIEQHLLIVGITLGIFAALIAAFFVIKAIISRRKKKNTKEQQL